MSIIIIYLILCAIIGITYCFYGNKWFYTLLSLTLFCTGSLIVINIMGTETKSIIIAIIVGAICALLSKFLYKANLFIVGIIIGAALSLFVVTFLPNVSQYKLFIVIGVALLFGIIAVSFSDIFISISTAATGATLLSSTLCFTILNATKLSNYVYADGQIATLKKLIEYIGGDFTEHNALKITIGTVALFLMGFIYQRKND